MSGPADALQRLCEAEGQLRATRDRIAELRRVLEGDPAAGDPRPRLLQAQAKRSDLARRLEEAEAHERSERARARSHEQQLFSGAIHNPRELSQLADELAHLKGRLATEEVEEIELLGSLDDADREVAEALAEASAAHAERLKQEKQAEDIARRIAEQRATIPAAHVRLYDRVVTYRPAPPVVGVVNGACAGCRIPLSLTKTRALRMTADPLTCETCGRILTAP